jgi:membrane protease YdiL (CAAX protease family)
MALAPWPLVYFGLDTLHSAWAAFLIYHGWCFLCWAANREGSERQKAEQSSRSDWISAIGLAVIVNIIIYTLAARFIDYIRPDQLIKTLHYVHAIGNDLTNLGLFSYFLIVNPIAEELFWRETIFQSFRRNGWSNQKSSIVSGILFGAWHWIVLRLLLPLNLAVIAVLGIIAVGVILGLIFERNRNLNLVIFTHSLAADLPVLIILWVAMKHYA